MHWVPREDPLLWGLFHTVKPRFTDTRLKRANTSLLRTVCFVPGERKSLYFL